MCSEVILRKDLQNLPEIRGKYRYNSNLSKVNWFQIGGNADVIFWPEDAEDLQYFLQEASSDIPITTIGVGSNLLVRDKGVRGVVIRLGKSFTKLDNCDGIISAGAGSLSSSVANFALANNISGLEFLVGIPGSVGGAIAMNAGAYGREVKDIFTGLEAIDRKGERHCLNIDDVNFSYRSNDIDNDYIFTKAFFRGEKSNHDAIKEKMDKIKYDREKSQPVKTKTSGSTFRNPDSEQANGKKAWELIDEAGCRGLAIGDAMVSEKHCNFLINKNKASAADMENLGEEVRKRVKLNSGVDLEWEIKRIGEY